LCRRRKAVGYNDTSTSGDVVSAMTEKGTNPYAEFAVPIVTN